MFIYLIVEPDLNLIYDHLSTLPNKVCYLSKVNFQIVRWVVLHPIHKYVGSDCQEKKKFSTESLTFIKSCLVMLILVWIWMFNFPLHVIIHTELRRNWRSWDGRHWDITMTGLKRWVRTLVSHNSREGVWLSRSSAQTFIFQMSISE